MDTISTPTHVVIPNALEYLMLPNSERSQVLERQLADLSLFWEESSGSRVIVISASPLLEAFVRDISHFLGYAKMVCPSDEGGTLCENIARDPTILAMLRQAGLVQLHFWGATPQSYALVDKLQAQGVQCHAVDLPTRGQIIWYLDNKINARDFWMEHPNLHPLVGVPEARVCETEVEVRETVEKFIDVGAVLKSPKNDANSGVLILRREDLSVPSWVDIVEQTLALWGQGPWLVEQYVYTDSTSPYPCFQARIDPLGEIELIGAANQLVSSTGRYLGAEVGAGVLSLKVSEDIAHLARLIAEDVAKLGYRGYIGFDALLHESGRLLWGEINARRIATLVIFNVKRLLSLRYGVKDPSMRSWGLEAPGLTYHEIRSRLQPLLFPKNGRSEGLLITAAPVGRQSAFKVLAISEDGIASCRQYCVQASALLSG